MAVDVALETAAHSGPRIRGRNAAVQIPVDESGDEGEENFSTSGQTWADGN